MDPPIPHSVPPPSSQNDSSNGSELAEGQSSSVGKAGQTPPPYWSQNKSRTASNFSYESVLSSQRPPAILLEDNTEPEHPPDSSKGLWAKGISIDNHVVVSGNALGSGAYVTWICKVETLEGGALEIRKRYSEFDRLRMDLAATFPKSLSALPSLPPKSIVSKFRASFLEKRRQGLQYFLNCVVLNPEFAGSPILKEFVFS